MDVFVIDAEAAVSLARRGALDHGGSFIFDAENIALTELHGVALVADEPGLRGRRRLCERRLRTRSPKSEQSDRNRNPVQLEMIRRYPVKAIGGEFLDRVTLDERGLIGDRWFAVRDEERRFAPARTPAGSGRCRTIDVAQDGTHPRST